MGGGPIGWAKTKKRQKKNPKTGKNNKKKKTGDGTKRKILDFLIKSLIPPKGGHLTSGRFFWRILAQGEIY